MSLTQGEKDLIEWAEAHPVRSRDHQFTKVEQAQYNTLKAKGRTLYDNLRTQFDVDHEHAYAAALLTHGLKVSN